MKDRHKTFFKRITSIFVTLTMCLGLLNVTAFASYKGYLNIKVYGPPGYLGEFQVYCDGSKIQSQNYTIPSLDYWLQGTQYQGYNYGRVTGVQSVWYPSGNDKQVGQVVCWSGNNRNYTMTYKTSKWEAPHTHNYQWTYINDSQHQQKCPTDGATSGYPQSHDKSWQVSSTPATCAQPSSITWHCNTCNHNWTETGSYATHYFSDNWQDNGDGREVRWCNYHIHAEYRNAQTQTYKVTYYDRGSQYAQDTYKQGATATVRSCTNTRVGYKFLGWSTNSAATSADWDAGETFTVNSNVDLHAVWQKVTKANYRVEWYVVEDTKPSSAQTPLRGPEGREGVVGATVSASTSDKTISGYTYLSSVSTESATLASEGTVLKLLFRRSQPNKATVTVVKTFAGLTRSQVPQNYQLVMKNFMSGSVLKTLSLSDAAVSSDGLTYTWTLRDMATEYWGGYTTVGGSYSKWSSYRYQFSESNYAVPGYAVTVTTAATGISASSSPTPERMNFSFRVTDVTSATVQITNTYAESVDWTVEWFKGYDVKTFEDFFDTGTLVKDTTPIKTMTVQAGKGTVPTVADSVYPGKDGQTYPELSPSDQQYSRKHVGWAQPVVDEANHVIKIKALWETTATERVTSYKKHFHVVDANGNKLGNIPENLISKDFKIDMVVTDPVTGKTLHTQTFNRANGSLDGVYNDTWYFWTYRFDYIIEHGYSMVKTESDYEIAGYTHVGTDKRTRTEPAKETPVLEVHEAGVGFGDSASTESWTNEYTKNTITVTWKDGYTDTPIKTETIDEGGDYSKLYPTNNPTRDGYDFIGWGKPEPDDDGNITIIAQWKVHVHDYTQTKAPTCTEDGEEKCSCGDTRPIDKLGHDWGEWTVKTPATCTTDGEEERVCGRDHNHVETRPIDKLGHDWGEWTVKTPATCTTDGVEERVCGRDHNHVETRPIDKLGHDWGEWKDNGDGTHSQVCNRDESHINTEKEPHQYGEWTTSKEPTETEPGEEEHVCEDCGHKETKPIPAKGDEEDPPKTDVTVKATDTDGTDPGTWTDGSEGEKDLPSDEDGKVKVPTSDDITPPDGKELDKWVDQDGNEYTPGEEIEPDKDLILTPVWKDKDEEITDIPDDNPPLAEPDDDNNGKPDDNTDDIPDDDVPQAGPDTPKTGDNSAAPMALLVLVFSGACLVWALSSKKRRTFSK